jgi:hypothetical protein
MPHLFKLNTKGEVFDVHGNYIDTLRDSDSIFQFMAAVRMTLKVTGNPNPDIAIFATDDEIMEWEAATVARERHRTEANGLCYVENCDTCGK